MFRLHTLSTTRAGGKTKHLINQISGLIMLCPSSKREQVHGLVVTKNEMMGRYIKDELPFFVKHNNLIYATPDNFVLRCLGMRFDAVFVDEYQNLTPTQMDALFTECVLREVKDLYLVGDLGHTADLLRNTTKATESLKRENELLRAEIDRLR